MKTAEQWKQEAYEYVKKDGPIPNGYYSGMVEYLSGKCEELTFALKEVISDQCKECIYDKLCEAGMPYSQCRFVKCWQLIKQYGNITRLDE